MQLRFKKIILHNFFCFVHEEVNLEDMGYTIVTGVNNHKADNALSNGSGKSSIFNAICYALTGETAQGLSNNVENIFSDANDCWVELSLSVDEDDFVIKRIKTPRSDLKIFINGEDYSGKGIKESSKHLAEYLPDLTSTLLGSIIILGQGLPSKFTEGHPGYRKEKLEKLTKSDFMIQSIRDKLDARQDELKLQLRHHEDLLIANNTQLEIYNKQLSNYKNELLSYDKYKNIDLDEKLKSIHIKINKCLGEKGNFSIKRDNISSEIEKLNTQILNYNNEHIKKLNEGLEDFLNKKDELNNRVISLTSSISFLKKEIDRLSSISDVCPTCGQKIPNSQKVDITGLNTQLSNNNLYLDTTQKELNNVNKEITFIKSDFERIKKLDLDKLNAELKEFKNDLKECENEFIKCNNDYQEALQEELKLKNLKENYDRISTNIDATEKLIKNLEDGNAKINTEIFTDNEHLSVIQSLITLTKREFRGILLENVIKYINNKVKQYSQEVFGSELLSFTLNENYIDIMYDNKYYEALSGGEKQKVDIIIQLALRDLLSSQLGIHSNILVLDEIFDNLDVIGCQKIIDLISKISDIESVFIISHHAEGLQISYDSEIVVEKGDDNISSIYIR